MLQSENPIEISNYINAVIQQPGNETKLITAHIIQWHFVMNAISECIKTRNFHFDILYFGYEYYSKKN